MKQIQSILNSFKGNPVKSVLTLITVGLGVGVLIIAISISSYLSQTLSRELENEGTVVYFSNSEYSAEGVLERIRPPQMDENVVEVVSSEVDGITAIAPISETFWNEVKAGEYSYQIRTVIGSTEEYAQVMDIKLISGNFFTATDVEQGKQVAVISEGLAVLLFGSVEEALGRTIQPPAMSFGQRGGDRTTTVQNFTVIGIYSDPSELKRKAYGVADLVIPYTAALPAGVNIQQAQRLFLSTLVLKVEGMDLATLESQLQDVLTREYGDDLKLVVWEGTPHGESTTIEEARQTVDIFTLVVNILGFVLLITGSIGILSIMLVEILGKTKEIALERALGASRKNIVKEYFVRSLLLTLISVVIGIILSLVFARPLTQLLLPLFETMGITEVTAGVLSPIAVLIGATIALVIGGGLGVFPVFSTMKIGLAEGIREA